MTNHATLVHRLFHLKVFVNSNMYKNSDSDWRREGTQYVIAGVLLWTQGSAVSSVKLFLSALKKAPRWINAGQTISPY